MYSDFERIFCIDFDPEPFQSQKITFSGYSTSWYRYDRKYNKNLIMLLMKAEQTIDMTAGGFFNISLETFKVVNMLDPVGYKKLEITFHIAFHRF